MFDLSVATTLLSAIPLSHHVTKYIQAIIAFKKDPSLLCKCALSCLEFLKKKGKK